MPWVIAAVGLTTAAVALSVSSFRRQETTPSPQTRFVVSLPSDLTLPGSQNTTMPVVSPDGRRVAFVATRAGVNQIWIRPLDALEAQPVSGTEDGSQMFWSPDSRSIGFSAAGKLKTVEVPGGPVKAVCDTPLLRGATWNRDGVILLGSLAGGIFKVSASGGQPAAVTKPDESHGESAHRFPSFLPDGRRFLYVAFPSSAIWIGSIDGSPATRLMTAASQAEYAPPGYLLFVRETELVAQPFDATRLTLSGEPVAIARDPSVDLNGSAAFSVSETGTLAVRTWACESHHTAQVGRSERHDSSRDWRTGPLPQSSPIP